MRALTEAEMEIVYGGATEDHRQKTLPRPAKVFTVQEGDSVVLRKAAQIRPHTQGHIVSAHAGVLRE